MVLPAAKPAARPGSTPAADRTPSPTNGSPSMDLESFLRFSVEDLFHADTDLDRAMDLLAICRVKALPADS
jgi:hypothetical protein